MSTTSVARRSPDWSRIDHASVVVALLVIWQLMFFIAGDVAIASPMQTMLHLGQLADNELFWRSVGASVRALVYSFVITAVGGVVVGLALGFHRFSGRVAEPSLTSIYTIPKVTLYPLVLLVFGLGISAKVAFGVMHGVVPVVLFTMHAVMAISPVHLKTARTLRLTGVQTTVWILVPAVIPEIAIGLRVGFSLTLLGVIIGEMFASAQGLGFMIMNSINVHDVRTSSAVILILITFAILANACFLALNRRLNRGAR